MSRTEQRRAAKLQRPNRPVVVRALNAAGAALERAGVPLVQLDEDALIQTAIRQTGLTDFGDESFREPLRILLEAYDSEAKLNLAGRIAARGDTLQLLMNRLRLEADRACFPEIRKQQIRRPVFIVGLPRSGTTLLHGLLAQDPANRVPLGWEVMYPSPPPERANAYADPRIARAERQMQWLDRLAPDFKTIHPVNARQPQECIAITSHTFLSPRFHTTYWVPSYKAWLDRQDMRPAYAYHRRFLQHLQWRWPGERWVLKSPAHLFALEALFDTYPDAVVIQTHRDPAKVVGSVASLSAVLQGAFSDEIDLAAIGNEVSERWAAGLDHARRARTARGSHDDRLFDVHYSELVRDPMGTVRRIYAHLGFDFTAEAAARMSRFVAENPQNKHGEHRYSLAQFGLDREEERQRYEVYRTHFGIEREST